MIVEFIFLAFIAGLISLDVTAFGRFMISRPIVCSTIFGYLLGDIKSGLWIGMIIELIWIGIIPMGAAIPNDISALAVLTVVWGMKSLNGGKSELIFALLFAVPSATLFKYIEIQFRYINIKVARWVEKGIDKGDEKKITLGVFLGLLLYFLKGFMVFLLFIYIGNIFIPILYAKLPEFAIKGLGYAWKMLPIIGFSTLLVKFHNRFPCPK